MSSRSRNRLRPASAMNGNGPGLRRKIRPSSAAPNRQGHASNDEMSSVFARPFSQIQLQDLVEVERPHTAGSSGRRGVNLDSIYREIKAKEREIRERSEQKKKSEANARKKEVPKGHKWSRPAIVSGVGLGSIMGKGTLNEIMSGSLEEKSGDVLRSTKGSTKKLSNETRVSAPSENIRAVQLASSISAAKFNENNDSHFGRSMPKRSESAKELKKLSKTIRKLVGKQDDGATKMTRVSSFSSLARHTSSAIERVRSGSKNSKMLLRMHAIETSSDTRDQHLASILREPTPKVVVEGSSEEAMSEMMKTGFDHPLHLEWESDPSFKFDPYSSTANSDKLPEVVDSPRLAFSKHESAKLHNAVRVMMEFTDKQMEEIRSLLTTDKVDKLNMHDFVKYAMLVGGRNVSARNHREIEAWCDVFCEADYNSNSFLSYSEFVTYLVELANARHAGHHLDKLLFTQYEPSIKPMMNNHGMDFARCEWIDPLNCFLAFEENCPRMKVYDCNMNLVQTKRGHVGTVLDAAYLPQHKMMVTCESGRAAGNNLRFFSAHQRFSDPDFLSHLTTWKLPAPQHRICWTGSALCTADSIGNILIWNVSSGETKQVLAKHTDIVHDLLPIPSSHYFVSGSRDTTVRLWDGFSGKSNLCFQGHTQSVKSLAYSSDYGILASGGDNDFVLLWSPLEQKAVRKLRFRQEGRRKRHGVRVKFGAVVSMRVHQNELIVADEERVVRVYDFRTFKELQTFNLPLLTVKSGMMETDEKAKRSKAAMGSGLTQVSLSSDIVRPAGSAALRHMSSYHASRAKVQRKEGKTELKEDQKLTEHMLIFSCGPFLYKYRKQAHVRLDACDDNSIGQAVFNARTLSFLTEASGNIKIWDAMTGRLTGEFRTCRKACKKQNALVTACALDHRGSRFYLGYEHGEVHVFDYRTGTLSHSLDPPLGVEPSEILHIEVIEVEDKSGYGDDPGLTLNVVVVSKSTMTSYSMSDDKMEFYTKSTLVPLHCTELQHHKVSCCAISETLGWIALGGVDGTIKVFPTDLVGESEHVIRRTGMHDQWERSTPARVSEVTSVAFLQHFPVIVASYSGGHVEGYYLLPRKRVMRIFQVHNLSASNPSPLASTVTFLKIDEQEGFRAVVEQTRKYTSRLFLGKEPAANCEECLLYTLDDNGALKTWDICSVVDACRSVISLVKEKALTRLGLTETELRDKHYRRIIGYVTEGDVAAAFKTCLVECRLSLRPHDGVVRGMDIVYQSEDVKDKCILSCGEDGRVLLHHTGTGEKLGDLRQSYVKVNPPAPTAGHWNLQIDFGPRKTRHVEFIRDSVEKVLQSDIVERLRAMADEKKGEPIDLSSYKSDKRTSAIAEGVFSDSSDKQDTRDGQTSDHCVDVEIQSVAETQKHSRLSELDDELDAIEDLVSRRPQEKNAENDIIHHFQADERGSRVYHELTAPVLEKDYTETVQFGLSEEEERKQALEVMAREIQAKEFNSAPFGRRANQKHAWESMLEHAPPDVMTAYTVTQSAKDKRWTRRSSQGSNDDEATVASVVPGVADHFRKRWNVRKKRPATAGPLRTASYDSRVDHHGSSDAKLRWHSKARSGSHVGNPRRGSHIGLERAMDDVSLNQKQRFMNIYPAFRMYAAKDPNLRATKGHEGEEYSTGHSNAHEVSTHYGKPVRAVSSTRKSKHKKQKESVHVHRFGYTSTVLRRGR